MLNNRNWVSDYNDKDDDSDDDDDDGDEDDDNDDDGLAFHPHNYCSKKTTLIM